MRIERDSMGEVAVPDDAYYGASTQRAVENFPISDLRFGRRFVWALGLIKASAAEMNASLGVVDAEVAEAIVTAGEEMMAGKFDDQFVVDVFQTGSGTSTNMNANEVLANRAAEILGDDLGSELVHPNDQVNASQSSNDVIPTAMHVAAVASIEEDLLPALRDLQEGLAAKAEEFDDVLKSGRTHLQDATPIRLGQEFSGYAAQIAKGIGRIAAAEAELLELALGGTAVGTGINAPEGFAAGTIEIMTRRSGYEFREAGNHFEAQAAKDAYVNASGVLKTVATSLFKIANDLRWLSSGPRNAIGEITLPSLQPGSSIMPGKVNPVIPEAVMMIAARVFGNDATITWGAANGNFELNVMMPVMAHAMLESIQILANGSRVLQEKTVDGIVANEERAAFLLDQNAIIATALVPHIGYDKAAEITKRAFQEGRGVREIALEMEVLPPDELDAALDVRPMTEGGI
ncbi:MAG: class II fumarate hydratase [Acidobacteria bacterium]|nr:class II fumarate hydratase [Acidobacteriota bacterium]MCH8990449.1 class II fumarate hydratase [Acidobacteriota bacterium]